MLSLIKTLSCLYNFKYALKLPEHKSRGSKPVYKIDSKPECTLLQLHRPHKPDMSYK